MDTPKLSELDALLFDLDGVVTRTATIHAAVHAGRDGGFGLVVGVDRGGAAAALRDAGADVVCADLTVLLRS